MIVIALLLLAVVVVLIVAAVTGRGDLVTIDALNVSIETYVTEVFLAGVLTGLLALAGLVLLRVGLRRSRQRRQEVRELRRQAQATPAAAETPATSDAAAVSDTDAPTDARTASEAPARADDDVPDRPVTTTDRETFPPSDTTDQTTEPHRS
ncbi:MAG: hypothetical protein ACRD0W_19225 [Acidimicrobiales bacterium]